MTYLLAAGCSWTDANFKSDTDPSADCSFYKWPDLLAKELNIKKVVNNGSSGASNSYIFKTCYDTILHKKPELVCILLTGWDRVSIFNYHITLYYLLAQRYFSIREKEYDAWTEIYLKHYTHLDPLIREVWQYHMSVDTFINETLRDIMLFQDFCNKHDVRYIIMQGVAPVVTLEEPFFEDKRFYVATDDRLRDEYEYFYSLLVSDYTSHIDTEKLIGWPFLHHDGRGYSMDFTFYEDPSFRLSSLDNHPGPKGHAAIAENFLKEIKRVYPKYNAKHS